MTLHSSTFLFYLKIRFPLLILTGSVQVVVIFTNSCQPLAKLHAFASHPAI